jgi:inhibitor of KinA sporulation pathway (predicted exonuclease)
VSDEPALSWPLSGSVVVFDLEFTSWPGAMARQWSGPGEHREVVSIGAVKLAAREGLPEIDHLLLLVRPRINPALSGYFMALTGLTQPRVDREGLTYAEALRRLAAFLGDDVVSVFSNGSDEQVLIENCQLAGLEFPFPRRLFRDLRGWLAAATGTPESAADTARLPGLMGFARQGRAHDALDDARVVAEALRRLRSPRRA